jgi:transposase
MNEVLPQLSVLGVGIDVSKAKLDVAFVYDQHEEVKGYSNDETGLATLVSYLRQAQVKCKIVMESTGRYHLLAALRLSEAGLDVRVINPLIAKRYFSSKIRKVKTDKADAQVLAQVALLEKELPKPFVADKLCLKIRLKLGLLASLEHQLQSFKAMLDNYLASQHILGIASSQLEVQVCSTLTTLTRQVDKLEQELTQLILDQTRHSQALERLQTLPGISPSVAALIVQFLDLDGCQHPKQWIAFVGLDISVRESGQWRGRCKLTKRGNPYLRKRLYSAAWGAMMNYPDFRKYYDHLKSQGKSHVEALLTIARKLLRIAFALLKQQQPYDPKRVFAS